MNKSLFSLDFEVRDYECDLQGIVNNANYMHYLEHTRHKFLLSKGVDFAKLHDEGIDAVVIKAELSYKNSLKSGDAFYCTLNVEMRGRLKIIFNQKIFRKKDKALILEAIISSACVQNGKPIVPKVFIEKLF